MKEYEVGADGSVHLTLKLQHIFTHTMKAYGGTEYLKEVSGQFYAPTALPPRKEPPPPRYSVHKNLGVPQNQSERSEREVSLASATNQPAFLRAYSPQLRHYPDSLPLSVCVVCFVLLSTPFVIVCCQVDSNFSHNAKYDFAFIMKKKIVSVRTLFSETRLFL